jgi:uncharacterized protein YcfL
MRNVLFLVLSGFLFLGCASSPDSGSESAQDSNTKAKLEISAPVFDRPHAIVLDMWSYGSRSYEDYVKVYNSTLHENISFNVFGYDAKNDRWVIIGSARLKKVADRDTIGSPLKGKLDHFRWFAIHSLDNLEFNAQAVISRNDILITVFEEGLNDW